MCQIKTRAEKLSGVLFNIDFGYDYVVKVHGVLAFILVQDNIPYGGGDYCFVFELCGLVKGGRVADDYGVDELCKLVFLLRVVHNAVYFVGDKSDSGYYAYDRHYDNKNAYNEIKYL